MMNAIRIRKTIDSPTLTLPELQPYLGKTVEIIILEEDNVCPGSGDWDAAMKAVADLEDYDFDAVKRQRENDLKHAKLVGSCW
jgi:hypothetical protein